MMWSCSCVMNEYNFKLCSILNFQLGCMVHYCNPISIKPPSGGDKTASGADLGFFKHKSNDEGVRHAREVWGNAPRKILKYRVSEMRFQAFWW